MSQVKKPLWKTTTKRRSKSPATAPTSRATAPRRSPGPATSKAARLDPGGILGDPHRPGIRITFEIKGNHENPRGNPIPKARFTFRQQRYGAAQRYHEYLDYVRACFFDATTTTRRQFRDLFYGMAGRKPLTTGDKKVRMDIFIEWGSNAHGDPENIFGAIADAIFANDKYLSGGFDFAEQPRAAGGRVSVRIFIPR